MDKVAFSDPLLVGKDVEKAQKRRNEKGSENSL